MQPITASDLDSLVGTTFLQGVTHFEMINSTNSVALVQLDAQPSLPVPHLIYAETQTAGRGRGANVWWSSAGSLTFTLIIDTQKLDLSAERQMLIPLLAGLAVLRACGAILSELPPAKSSHFFTPVEDNAVKHFVAERREPSGNVGMSQTGGLAPCRYHSSVLQDKNTSQRTVEERIQDEAASQNVLARLVLGLKWPNDVYLAGRKLAGILCEVPSAHRHLALVGVGINVNNSFAQTSVDSLVDTLAVSPGDSPVDTLAVSPIHSPAEIRAAAISLSDHSGQMHNRLLVLKMFIEVLETFLKECAGGVFALDAWRQHCLLTGKEVTLQTGNTRVTGICRGIADSGAIIIETPAGPQELLGGSIVSWR